MKKVAVAMLLAAVMVMGAGFTAASYADDDWAFSDNGVFYGPSPDQMTERYNNAAPVAKHKSYCDFYGPSADEMAEAYQNGTPVHKPMAVDHYTTTEEFANHYQRKDVGSGY